MEVVAASLVTAMIGLVGVVLAYVLGKERTRYDRLHEKRADVIARISELLLDVQSKYAAWVFAFGRPEGPDRRQSIQEAGDTFAEFIRYTRSHSIWLSPLLNRRLEAFIEVAWDIGTEAGTSLDDQGDPDEASWEVVRQRVTSEIPTLRRELEEEFREILYPPPFYGPVLRLLAGVLEYGRGGRRSRRVPR